MISIAMIADVLTEDPDLLVEDGATRRQFLRAAGSNILGLLTASGLSPATAKALSTTAVSSDPPRLMARMTAGATSRYEPDVADSLKEAKVIYNMLRKLLGTDVQIGAATDADTFIMGGAIDVQDLPRLLRSGEAQDFSEGEGDIYIEIDLPGNDMLAITNSDDLNLSEINNLGQLLKTWWNDWEKWGTGYLDKDMFQLLRKNGIDPVRPNITTSGYNAEEVREAATGSTEPEEWEGVRSPEPDIRDYAVASPMHQWYESQLSSVLDLLG